MMEKAMILLALWTLLVNLIGVGSRIYAAKKGWLELSKFRVLQAQDMPPYVLRTHKHLTNLFEFPVIFYMLCLLIMIKELQIPGIDTLAWMYLGFRLFHSVIHLGPNILPLRTLSFVASQIVLVVIAIHTILKLN